MRKVMHRRAAHACLDVAVGQLRRMRELVLRAGRRAGLDSQRQHRLMLAVNEAATNAITHGGGRGRLEITQDDGKSLIAEVTDHGPGLGTLPELTRPEPDAAGGRGLWIMYETCDRVELRTGPRGTTVRLEMALTAG